MIDNLQSGNSGCGLNHKISELNSRTSDLNPGNEVVPHSVNNIEFPNYDYQNSFDSNLEELPPPGQEKNNQDEEQKADNALHQNKPNDALNGQQIQQREQPSNLYFSRQLPIPERSDLNGSSCQGSQISSIQYNINSNQNQNESYQPTTADEVSRNIGDINNFQLFDDPVEPKPESNSEQRVIDRLNPPEHQSQGEQQIRHPSIDRANSKASVVNSIANRQFQKNLTENSISDNSLSADSNNSQKLQARPDSFASFQKYQAYPQNQSISANEKQKEVEFKLVESQIYEGPGKKVIEAPKNPNKIKILSFFYSEECKSTVCFTDQVIGKGSQGQIIKGIIINQKIDNAEQIQAILQQKEPRNFEFIAIKEIQLTTLLNNQEQKYYTKEKMEQLTSYIQNEYNIPKALNNKGVIHVYDAFQHKQSVYILMELCSYGLDRLIGVPGFPYKHKISIIKQIVETLSFMHEKNIAHRDLKPENILIQENNATEQTRYTAKLVDFGLSKQIKLDKQTQDIGTLVYQCPEFKSGCAESDPKKNDIWSLGVIIYKFLYGQLPWTSEVQIFYRECNNKKLQFPKSLEVDSRFQHLLKNMLNREQKYRCTAKQVKMHPVFTGNDFSPENLVPKTIHQQIVMRNIKLVGLIKSLQEDIVKLQFLQIKFEKAEIIMQIFYKFKLFFQKLVVYILTQLKDPNQIRAYLDSANLPDIEQGAYLCSEFYEKIQASTNFQLQAYLFDIGQTEVDINNFDPKKMYSFLYNSLQSLNVSEIKSNQIFASNEQSVQQLVISVLLRISFFQQYFAIEDEVSKIHSISQNFDNHKVNQKSGNLVLSDQFAKKI